MKNLIYLFCFSLFAIVGHSRNQISEATVRTLYQPDQKINLIKKDIDFWSYKLAQSPNQTSYLIKLASANNQLFSVTGQIEALKKSENFLLTALTTPLLNRSTALRSLAHNYISQHRFCEALDLVLEAEAIGENRFANNKMLFDIYLELGDDEQARIHLAKITNEANFDYLIRKSKWEDGKGNLEKAISYLEKAQQLAEASKNQTLMAWIYSNLADYYGHNGEIEKSYAHFKKTLQLDPANWYALKGIAWIAYAHDNNLDLSQNILAQILQNNERPELYLKLGELAKYRENIAQANEAVNNFQKMSAKPSYGVMYHKYQCLIAAENLGDFNKAYRLAKQEIIDRPTVESYDLLAWVLFLDGKIEAAQTIATEHIVNKTSEPAILLHLAHIFFNDPIISEPILKELKSAGFELGPIKTREIRTLSQRISSIEKNKIWKLKLIPELPNPFWFLG